MQVGAEAVARCERGRLTLRPGAELAAGRVSEGLLGLAIDKARVRSQRVAVNRAHVVSSACLIYVTGIDEASCDCYLSCFESKRLRVCACILED